MIRNVTVQAGERTNDRRETGKEQDPSVDSHPRVPRNSPATWNIAAFRAT